MAVSMIGPKFYAWDRNGKPLAFGKLYTYQARTNVPKPTYQSEDAVVENTNPVILNGEGYANIYLDGSYKMVLKDSDENEIWSSDPVTDASQLAKPWVNESAITYVGPSQFKVPGNSTDIYQPGRALQILDATTIFGYVETVSFLSGETFVTVDAGTSLTPSASKAWVGVATVESIPNGGLAIAGSKINGFNSIENLYLLTGNSDGLQISVKGYLPNSDVGGGVLYWDANGDKSDHDGFRTFSPTVPWSDSADYYNGDGETDPSGKGVWKKLSNYLKDKLIEAQVERIAALIASGDLVWSVLGDSTEAGVGAGGGVYAQCNNERQNGWANYVSYYMLRHDPAFINLSEEVHGIAQPFFGNEAGVTNEIALPYPTYQETKSSNRTIEFFANNVARNTRSKFSIYINERTSDAACAFTMTVRDGKTDAILYQGQIDTYTGQETFGSAGSFDVSGRIAKRTVDLTSASRYIKVTLENFITIDRGAGVAADGTAAIYGFSFGEGVEFHNLSVSSTTLKNNSSANQSRGVTTSGRLSLAQSFGSNMYSIGFGTNDSKSGVSSPGEFRVELNELIDDILSGEPDAVIVLNNDPRGLASPYDQNYINNQIIRDIAEERGFILLDVEKMSDTLDGFYADNVHPSSEGVYQITQAFCDLAGVQTVNFSLTQRSKQFNKLAGEFEVADATAIPTSYGEIFAETLARNDQATFLSIRADLILKDATSSINTSVRLKINGTVFDEKRVATVDASGTTRLEINLAKVYEFGGSTEYIISLEAIDNIGGGSTEIEARSTVSFHWI